MVTPKTRTRTVDWDSLGQECLPPGAKALLHDYIETHGIVCFEKEKNFSFAWADVVIIGHGTAEFGGVQRSRAKLGGVAGRRSLHPTKKYQREREKKKRYKWTRQRRRIQRKRRKKKGAKEMRQGRLWPAHLLATAAAAAMASVVDNSLARGGGFARLITCY